MRYVVVVTRDRAWRGWRDTPIRRRVRSRSIARHYIPGDIVGRDGRARLSSRTLDPRAESVFQDAAEPCLSGFHASTDGEVHRRVSSSIVVGNVISAGVHARGSFCVKRACLPPARFHPRASKRARTRRVLYAVATDGRAHGPSRDLSRHYLSPSTLPPLICRFMVSPLGTGPSGTAGVPQSPVTETPEYHRLVEGGGGVPSYFIAPLHYELVDEIFDRLPS